MLAFPSTLIMNFTSSHYVKNRVLFKNENNFLKAFPLLCDVPEVRVFSPLKSVSLDVYPADTSGQDNFIIVVISVQ